MTPLYLEDNKGYLPEQVRGHVIQHWNAPADLDGMEILIAYESVGSWGCDSNGWYLLKKGDEYYEVHGSHCSCYGFEEQWKPEKTTVAYLLSEQFSFGRGGYDSDSEGNFNAAKEWIRENLQ